MASCKIQESERKARRSIICMFTYRSCMFFSEGDLKRLEENEKDKSGTKLLCVEEPA